MCGLVTFKVAHYAENGIYNWIIRLKGYNTDAEEYTGTLQLMR